MARVIVADLADTDTAEIIANLSQTAGKSVAARYSGGFDQIYRRLELFPEMGAKRPRLGKDTRVCVLSPYVIIYDYLPDDDVVAILRILHGRRKIVRRLVPRST